MTIALGQVWQFRAYDTTNILIAPEGFSNVFRLNTADFRKLAIHCPGLRNTPHTPLETATRGILRTEH